MEKKIFLSSTAEDLDDYRERLAHEIQHFDLLPVRMETFGAMPERSVDACLQRVSECDALVLVVAHRYGWIPEPDAGGDGRKGDGVKSITWLEYEEAERLGKPTFAYLVDEDYGWARAKEQDRLNDPQADVARRVSQRLARAFLSLG